jgi:hypothetical protein
VQAAVQDGAYADSIIAQALTALNQAACLAHSA